MTYKKLFPIKYNNKKFMLFLDESNRITFLEMNDKGDYEYPLLEDFTFLNKMYNNRDPLICYRVPKFTFKECVKVAKNGVISLLSVIAVINSMPSALAASSTSNILVSDSSVTVTIDSPDQEKQEKPEIYIEDLDDLNKYLGYLDVIKEMVTQAIDQNSNMPDRYKRLAKELLDTMLNNNPDTNLRIFYENVKTMRVFEYTLEEFRKKFPEAPGGGAQYNCYLNAITTIDLEEDETIRHELYHAFNSLHFETNDKIVVRYDRNKGINESMTDIGIEGKYGYVFTRLVTNYLRTLVPYTVSDFNAKGTNDLLQKLKAKYPDVDINYINETLNTYNVDCIAQGHTIKIDEMEDLTNELFEMCLKEANLNSGYVPFNNFAKIFSNAENPKLVFEYFRKYNNHLKEIGYPNILSEQAILDKLNIYHSIAGIGTSNHKVYPIARGEKEGYLRINPDGSTNEIVISSALETKGIFSQMNSTIFAYYDLFGTDEYWYQLNKDAAYISPHSIEAIPIYNKGVLITKAMPKDLRIQVGFKNEEIGFVISNEDGEVIFKTDDNLTYLSNPVNFSDYITLVPSYITRVELDNILNVRHLRNFQRIYPNDNFKNINMEDNRLSVKEETKLTIEEENAIFIYDGKKLVTESKLSELYLEVGETKDKKLGFILSNKMGEIIYQSNPEIINTSSPINFSKYVGPSLSKLILSDVLNENYLKNFQKETNLVSNIEFVGEKIVIDASPRIHITRKENEKVITEIHRLSKCNVFLGNGKMTISDSNIPPLDADGVVKLETVLMELGVLNSGIPEYQFSLDEIASFINEYLYGVERTGTSNHYYESPNIEEGRYTL